MLSKIRFVLQLLIKLIFGIHSLDFSIFVYLNQCVTCCLLNYLCNLQAISESK